MFSSTTLFVSCSTLFGEATSSSIVAKASLGLVVVIVGVLTHVMESLTVIITKQTSTLKTRCRYRMRDEERG